MKRPTSVCVSQLPCRYVGTGTSGCRDRDGCATTPAQWNSTTPCFGGVRPVACTDVPAAEELATGRAFTCGVCPPGYAGNGVECSPCPVRAGGPADPFSVSRLLLALNSAKLTNGTFSILFFRPQLSVTIPSATFSGGRLPRAADAFLYGAVASPASADGFACASPGAIGGIAFAWSITTTVPGDPEPTVAPLGPANLATTRSLFVPARSLPAGAQAVAQLWACYSANSLDEALCGAAQLPFRVAASPLVAILRGANATVGSWALAVLDGSASFDPDSEPGPLSFSWSVVAATDPASNQPGAGAPVVAGADGSTSPTLSLRDLPPGRITVALTVSKGGRTAAATGTLDVQPGALPVIALQGPPQGVRVNPSARLVIAGSVQSSAPPGSLRVWWELVEGPGGLNLTDPATVATPRNSTSLVLLPGAMQPRAAYVLRLLAQDRNGLATADVSLATAGPPVGLGGEPLGTMSVSPQSGVALKTVFQARSRLLVTLDSSALLAVSWLHSSVPFFSRKCNALFFTF